MVKTVVDIACYCCFTPNRVSLGVAFYNSDAWYTCHRCGKHNAVSVRQVPLAIPTHMSADTIQKGEKIT